MSGNHLPEYSFMKTLVRWFSALLIVVFIYGGVTFAFYAFDKSEPPRIKGEQEAIMLEFAEEATAPIIENESETIQPEIVTEEEQQEKISEDMVEPEKTLEPEPIETPPSDMVEEVKPKVEEKPKVEPKKTKQVEQPKKDEPKPKPEAENGKQKQKASAPQINAKAGTKFAAPNNNRQQGSGGTADPDWKNKVQRRIDSVARRVGRQSGGLKGVVLVSFSYDGSGRVLSAQVARSSGKGNVDDVALKIARQSSPLPTPPQGKAGNVILKVQF